MLPPGASRKVGSRARPRDVAKGNKAKRERGGDGRRAPAQRAVPTRERRPHRRPPRAGRARRSGGDAPHAHKAWRSTRRRRPAAGRRGGGRRSTPPRCPPPPMPTYRACPPTPPLTSPHHQGRPHAGGRRGGSGSSVGIRAGEPVAAAATGSPHPPPRPGGRLAAERWDPPRPAGRPSPPWRTAATAACPPSGRREAASAVAAGALPTSLSPVSYTAPLPPLPHPPSGGSVGWGGGGAPPACRGGGPRGGRRRRRRHGANG